MCLQHSNILGKRKLKGSSQLGPSRPFLWRNQACVCKPLSTQVSEAPGSQGPATIPSFLGYWMERDTSEIASPIYATLFVPEPILIFSQSWENGVPST